MSTENQSKKVVKSNTASAKENDAKYGKMKEEIMELISFVLEKDVYLRTRLLAKDLIGEDKEDLIKELQNENLNPTIKELIKDKLVIMDGERNVLLMKKYGRSLLKDKFVSSVLGSKISKKVE